MTRIAVRPRTLAVSSAVFAAFVGVAHLAAAPGPGRAQSLEALKQLKETRICNKCDLRGADLTGLDLYGAQLKEADLEGAVLTETNLEMANLHGATGANFTGAKTDRRTTCPDGSAGPCQ